MPVDQHPAAVGVHTGDTSPIADQPSGSTVPGGNVAARAWSSPPVRSTPTDPARDRAPHRANRRTRRSAPAIRIPTPDASAMWPSRRRDRRRRRSSRSRRLPRPRRPARKAVWGPGARRSTPPHPEPTGPRRRAATPVPQQPTGRAPRRTATTSPSRAPERSTGLRPSRSPRTVTDTTTSSACTRSPPTTPAPRASAALPRPSEMPLQPRVGCRAGSPARRGTPSDALPSRQCPHRSGPPLFGPPARVSTSPAGSADVRRACPPTPRPGRPASAPRPRRRPARAASSTVACVVPRPARSPRTPPPTPRCDRRRPAASRGFDGGPPNADVRTRVRRRSPGPGFASRNCGTF